ncbi:MAG: hypothetical protein FWG23_01260 [Eggerthellaceae bacterium]|nr:hypothetical protein [Eggerthellaceae bacterium]
MKNERHVFILLTRHTDSFSQLILALIQGYYSHASIGFDEEKGRFYSFTRRGFHDEEPEKICQKRHNVPCVLYKIPVSHQAYDSMRSHLEHHYKGRGGWKYNIVGVFLGILKFPFLRRSNKRFCSQFVAEVLKVGNEVYLHKRSSVVFPDDFTKVRLAEPAFLGTLEGLTKRTLRQRIP